MLKNMAQSDFLASLSSELRPQRHERRVQRDESAVNQAQGGGGTAAETVLLTRVINYAVIVVGTLPIFCIYPFVQKYFVTGVMIGSIKG